MATPFEAFFWRLSRGRKALATFAAQALGGGLGLLLSLTAAWAALLPQSFQSQPSRFPLESMYRVLPVIIAMASTLALPLFLAYVAAFLTVTYVKSQEYPVLLVTTITNPEVVRGFALAVLKRCGALLAFQAGVLPLLAALFITEPNTGYFGLYSGKFFGWQLGWPGAALQFALALLAGTVFLIGLNGLFVSVAVALSLWWRNTIAAAAFTSAAVVVLSSGVHYYLGFFFGMPGYENNLMRFAVAGLLYLPVVWVVLRLAERWVRR